ncbi:MAG: GntR family transcriptional regulator [Burkholderiaceae bacterium]
MSAARRSDSSGAAAPSWSPRPGAAALSLPEQIAESIGASIIRGELDPGDRIHEQDLAERFSVSRGPAREALRILERDGLVQIHARRGARVTALTVDEVEEVFEMRAALLGLAARRIALRDDPGLRAEIRRRVDLLRAFTQDDDGDEYVQAANGLNLLVAGSSGSELLRATYYALAHRTLRYTRLGLGTAARRARSARNWRQLCVAFESHDADRARLLAERLVEESKATAVALLRDTPPPPSGEHELEQGPDRQPRRDRLPDRRQLPRPRSEDGRDPLRT